MYSRWSKVLAGGLAPFTSAALLCQSATGQARHVELSWQAPVGCPSRAQVVREVDDLIADSANAGHAAPIVADASVASDRGGFSLTLTLRNAGVPRSRRIGARTCEELGHAAALIVAIAIDPTILEGRNDPDEPARSTAPSNAASNGFHCRLTELPSPAQPASMPSRPCSPADVPTSPQTKPSPLATEPLFWRFGFGALGSLGVLPGFNLGANLLGAIQGKVARLEVAASMLSAEAESKTVQGRGATFALYRLAPRSCLLIAETSWAAGPCVGMELGLISGQGYGVTSLHKRTALWFASSIGAMVELRLAPSSFLGVSADMGIPWKSDRFIVADEPLYHPGISGSLGVNLAAGWH